MSHDRDHDHPHGHPPRDVPPAPRSKTTPDRKYCEHPTEPREPADPRPHPKRRLAPRPG